MELLSDYENYKFSKSLKLDFRMSYSSCESLKHIMYLYLSFRQLTEEQTCIEQIGNTSGKLVSIRHFLLQLCIE